MTLISALPEQHCVKGQELMREAGIDESTIRAAAAMATVHAADIKPEHRNGKVLFACDELSGLIGACALMLPPKAFRIWN